MDAGLPGKGAKAVFPFSPQEKNSFLDAFVVGGCFCRCFEKTSPPNFPLSWEFPPLSRKPPPFTSNPPFSFLPLPPPKKRNKQENSGACQGSLR